MDIFELPIRLLIAGRELPLVLSCRPGTVLADALPSMLTAAGASPGTRLFLGFGEADPAWTLGLPPLLRHSTLADFPTSRDDQRVLRPGAFTLSCVSGPDAGGSVEMSRAGVLIGRGPHADLRIADPALSRLHVRVFAQGQRVLVLDVDSTNGMRIDGEPVASPAHLLPGELLRIGGSLFQLSCGIELPGAAEADGGGGLLLRRPPRFRQPWQARVIEPPPAAPVRHRRALPWLSAGLGAMLGFAMAAVTGMWMFLMLAAFGPIMMIANAFGDRVSGRRSHRGEMADHRLATADRLLIIGADSAADRLAAWNDAPDPATLLARAVARTPALWIRRPVDDDWLDLRLGVHGRPARLPIPDPPLVAEAPLCVNLARHPLLGIVSREDGLLRSLLCQLAALHSPADLELWIFSSDPELLRWADVPHVQAVFADPTGDLTAALAPPSLPPTPESGPRRVLVFDAWPAWRHHEQVRSLVHGRGTATSIICRGGDPQAIPGDCDAVVSHAISSGRLELMHDNAKTAGEADAANPAHCRLIIEALAPLVDADDRREDSPINISRSSIGRPDGSRLSLADVTGPWTVDDIRRRWLNPSVSAAIGRSGQSTVHLDLDRDGPHFLIAGTTGSGKSELLKTLVAGLALAAPPERLTLVLIDYKGGAAFAEAKDLPQVVGFVTDLDQAAAARALRSLRAELRRRELALAQSNHADVMSWAAAAPTEAVPRLVVVIDEFATLATDLPDFLDGLLDVAQRGRSLGVHLVLATQRPAGVVSPAVKSNLSGRICLRVTDPADSVDVLDYPEAASISSRTPGRALLRTEGRRPMSFQCAEVSSPLVPAQTTPVLVRTSVAPQLIPERSHDLLPGSGANCPSAQDTSPSEDRGDGQLTRLVAACVQAAEGGPRPRSPWLPPLPTIFEPDDGAPGGGASFALADLPDSQSRQLIPLPDGHLLIAGPARSGRTCALRAAALAADPGTELIVLDLNRGLADLAGWVNCVAYIDGSEPDLVLRALELLSRRIDRPLARPALLLVDSWESLTACLEPDPSRGTNLLTDIASRGQSIGIQVVLAGSARILHAGAAAAFPHVLNLGSPGSAATEQLIAAGHGRQREAAPAGRGRLGLDEVQIRRAPQGSTPSARRPHPLLLCPLPASVSATAHTRSASGQLPIGVGGDTAQPLCFPLTGPGGGFVVTGPHHSGVTNTLDLLGSQARRAGARVVTCVARPPAQLGEVDVRLDCAQLRSLLAAEGRPLMLIVDDAHIFQNTAAAAVFEQFLADAEPGRHLVVGIRPELAARAFRGFIADTAAFRHGILLQPDGADGQLLGVRLPRVRGLSRTGRGLYCCAGESRAIQVLAAVADEATGRSIPRPQPPESSS